MVHQAATIGEIFTANVARNRFVAMRLHVTLEPCFVVEILAAFSATVLLFSGMVPCVLDQRTGVLAMLTTCATRVLSQFGSMKSDDVFLNSVLVYEALAA